MVPSIGVVIKRQHFLLLGHSLCFSFCITVFVLLVASVSSFHGFMVADVWYSIVKPWTVATRENWNSGPKLPWVDFVNSGYGRLTARKWFRENDQMSHPFIHPSEISASSDLESWALLPQLSLAKRWSSNRLYKKNWANSLSHHPQIFWTVNLKRLSPCTVQCHDANRRTEKARKFPVILFSSVATKMTYKTSAARNEDCKALMRPPYWSWHW